MKSKYIFLVLLFLLLISCWGIFRLTFDNKKETGDFLNIDTELTSTKAIELSDKNKVKTNSNIKSDDANIKKTTNMKIAELDKDIFVLPADISTKIMLGLYSEITEQEGKQIMQEMAMLPAKEALKLLLPVLDTPYRDVKIRAFVLATRLSSDSMIPFYSKALDDSDDSIKTRAIRTISTIAHYNSEIIDKIKKITMSNSMDMPRREATRFWLEQPDLIDEEIAERLTIIMSNTINDDENSSYGRVHHGRLNAAWALCKTSKGGDGVIHNLQSAFKQGIDKDGMELALAIAAGGALLQRGQQNSWIKQKLLDSLDHENEFVRASSIIGLSKFNNDLEIQNKIANIVTQEGINTKWKVFYAAGEFGKTANCPNLINTLESKLNNSYAAKYPYFKKFYTASALSKMKETAGYEALFELAFENDQIVTYAKLGAIGELRRESGNYFNYTLAVPDSSKYTIELKWKNFIRNNKK